MTNKRTEALLNLRKRAVEKTGLDGSLAAKPSSPGEERKFLHELQVHQIEIEMQNEELLDKQKELETALAHVKSSERFKQTIIDSFPANIAVIDQKGLITAVSKPWLQFGLDNEVMDDKCISVGADYLAPYRKAFTPDDSDDGTANRSFQGITSVLEGRKTSFVMDYPCHSPTEKRWYQMTVMRPETEFKGAVISHIDISTLKLFEEDRLSYILHLVEVIELERCRTARELHDDIGQKLTILSFAINKLKHISSAGSEDQETLLEMQAGVDSMMTSVRRICTNLRPALLDELGLPAALEWLCKDFTRQSKIPCRFTFKSTCCDKNMECSMTIFRIIQESLNNTMKHAGASKVGVSLSKKGGLLSVEINDDGCGITADRHSAVKTFGLLGMKERAHALGATFNITGKIGAGTSVKLVIPCKNEELKNASSHC